MTKENRWVLVFFLFVFSNMETSAQEIRIHPQFNFSTDDIAIRLPDLPPLAVTQSANFLELTATLLDLQEDYLYLVDKNHPLESNYSPSFLISLSDYPDILLNRKNLSLDKRAADSLKRMTKAAAKKGIPILVLSAYRPYSYQKNLFQRYALRYGEAAAQRFSAKAGHSQHQLGTVIDIGMLSNNFEKTPTGQWLLNNAEHYGWSLSYPRNMEKETGYMWESWHWRWISREAVLLQNKYFDGIQQRFLEFWNRNAPILNAARINRTNQGLSDTTSKR